MAENAAASPMAGLGNFPGGRQMILLVALSLSIAIGVTAAFWLREPSYELLYSNLSDRDVSAVMDALRAEGTPYRLDNGALLVPSAEVYNTRLRLSSQGLPRGAGFGLEVIEGESSFSTSQFM
ncbi:MAG: flagellar M-ring protein FliF, partial [Gammaproteobacteria bacterium]|nr:flagellar M-ring protein FliF [Gammaproteobacteria bacterium]